MKRKRSQKRTAKSRKKHASEKKVVKPPEPVTRQKRKYAEVDITLVPVNFKSPRRNVKPPKKYADEDFIYYNNVAPDEFGIDPSFLCECALDTSDPSIHCEDNPNDSESTVTASENGDNIADISNLCETVFVTPEPGDTSADNNQSTYNDNENQVEGGDDFVDLSQLCQTELITHDQIDPQAEINHLAKASHSEGEFILGLSDGGLDFASSIRHVEKKVSNKKPDKKEKSLLLQTVEKKENTPVAKRKAKSRRRTRPKSRRKKKKTNKNEKAQVQKNETNIPTESTAISVDNPRQDDVGLEITICKEVLVPTPEYDNPRKDDGIMHLETTIGVEILKPEDDHPRLDKEKISLGNTLDKEVPLAKSNADHSNSDEEKIFAENTHAKEVPLKKPYGDSSSVVENVCLENTFAKEILLTKCNTDHSSLEEEKVSSENILDNKLTLTKPNTDHSSLEEEKVSLENIFGKDVPLTKSNTDHSNLEEEKVSTENILDKELLLTKPNTDYSCLEEEKISSENIFAKEVREEPLLNPVAGEEADWITNSDEGKLCTIDGPNFQLQLKTEGKNLEDCSVPDTDSGCDVDMEQGCEEDENLNEGENGPVVNQMPYFNETRIIKVLLRRLEEEEFFSAWKEGKWLPKSAALDSLKPNGDGAKTISSEAIPAVSKSKKKKYRKNIWWDRPKKVKFVLCTICKKKFLNESTMKKHRGSPTCIVTHKCRICFAKFKSADRLLEHQTSSCNTERIFDCNTCGKSYAFKYHLEKHQVSNNCVAAVECRICHAKFKSTDRLLEHQKSSCNTERVFDCNTCGKSYAFKYHLEKHQVSNNCVAAVECRLCHAKFKSTDRLMEHQKSSCNTERVFDCNVCGKSYAFKKYLEQHQSPVCRSLKSISLNECKTCHEKFYSHSDLTRHLTTVHGEDAQLKQYLCEICGALLSSKDRFQHMEDLHTICKHCGKEFPSRRKLRKHKKIHLKYESSSLITHSVGNAQSSRHSSNKASQYTCAECGKSFPRLSRLKIHLAVHGMITSLKTFKCIICKKIFNENKNLQSHLKTHRDIKDYVCSKCAVSFNTYEDLKEHKTVSCVKLKIQNEENLSIKRSEQYVCHICGKWCSTSHHLKRHSVVHLEHKSSIICDVCGKKFKSTFHLSQHNLMISCDVSSTKYFCRECGKEFANFLSLKMHFIEVHNVKQPVKCDKCGKEFDDRRKLRCHLITHSEAYWTSCNYCGKVITKRSLKSHIASAHKSSSALGNNGSEVKLEPLIRTIKVEEQPNTLNDSGTLSTYSRPSENAKPKMFLNKHSEKNLLPCRFCGKILGSRRSLKRHVSNVHKSSNSTESLSSSLVPKDEPACVKTEEPTYVQNENYIVPSTEFQIEINRPRPSDKIETNGLACGICGKVLAHSSSLRKHMTRVHKVVTASTISQTVPTVEGVFDANEQSQLNLKSENVSPSERPYDDIKSIELQSPGSANSNHQLFSLAEQQSALHITGMQTSEGQNNQSVRSFNSNANTSLQTEQQVPEAPTSISCLTQNECQSSELSNTSILMSHMINAQNYKVYLPNTSFLNSQCQNIEVSSSIKSEMKHNNTGHITHLPQSHQNHYPSIEETSTLTPMAYVNHEVSTSNVQSLPIQEFVIPKVTGNSKVPPRNQYRNSEIITNVLATSLLDDKPLDMVDTIISSPPPVQTICSDTLFNIPIEEPLVQQFDNTQGLNANNHTEHSISYNYFIAPGCPDFSETLTHGRNLISDPSLPALCYQSSEIPDIGSKIYQQNVQVVANKSTNTYLLPQYIQPKPKQTTSLVHYQSPVASNTFIVLQPKLELESPRTSNNIISRTVPPLSQYTKNVETRGVEPYKGERPRFTCSLCTNLFYSKDDLNKHLIVHGLAFTSTHYRCTTCDKSFDLKYKYRAEQHLRIHTGEKPFPCNQCPERFRTTSLLNKHSLSHSKPLVPNKCSVCQASLSSNYNLRRHLKSVHKIISPQTYPQEVKEEYAKSFLENELSSLTDGEKSPIKSEHIEPLPNLQQPYMSQETSDFRDNEDLTSSHSYSYSFEESNGNHSDIALDLSDLRDDFVPDAMETVLKLENW